MTLRFESEDALRRETAKRRERFVTRGHVRVPERDILPVVLAFLKRHPKVAFAYRSQAGLLRSLDDDKHKPRKVRVGFKGLSDIVGMLRDGRFLACEVKADGGVISDDQCAFIDAVRAAGGIGFFAWGVDDVVEALA